MIAANELRIGNKLWESDSFTPGPDSYSEIAVASISDIDKVIRDDQGNGYAFDALYPIPLTSEWLERCGYKKDSIDKKWYKSPHNMPPIYQWKVGAFGMEGLPLGVRSIEFVHQLQNLYFALTGEELTINNEHIQTTS